MASLAAFLAQTVAVDLEVIEAGEVYAIGAVLGDRTFARHGRFDRGEALRALDTFCAPAERILGHNLLRHDLPVLRGLAPALRLLDTPAIDTLYLSPLAFPENPYHRLVKDYKLVRDALNDPVADARLARSVFRDQWESLAGQQVHHPERLALLRYCLADERMGRGLTALFGTLGAPAIPAGGAAPHPPARHAVRPPGLRLLPYRPRPGRVSSGAISTSPHSARSRPGPRGAACRRRSCAPPWAAGRCSPSSPPAGASRCAISYRPWCATSGAACSPSSSRPSRP